MMASTKISYQRLKKLPTSLVGEQGEEHEVVVLRRSWPRFRRWRRQRVRVAGLRRLLRRKARVVGAAVRVSVGKVLKRLKEGKPHIGEFFAGNYMFMQVSPSPTTMGSSNKKSLPPHHHHHLLPPPSSRLPLARVMT